MTDTRITPEWSARMAALEPEGCEIGAGALAMMHMEITSPLPEKYPAFASITRLLEQDIVVTEKLDGTNGLIYIDTALNVHAGSRERWLTPDPQDDNYGFAAWVKDNEAELRLKLGVGSHYGEWWGHKLQRNYGMKQRVFSLFNTKRWGDPAVRPACCDVVPEVFRGTFFEVAEYIRKCQMLHADGVLASAAAKSYGIDFRNPEGLMVLFTKERQYFKVPYKMGAKGKVE